MNRPPSPPPDLPGYTYLQHIGGGGFADVFLYEQHALGRRRVAVKVLLAGGSDPGVRAQFDAEAALMARLSTHPHIVSIHDAAIAADGRPYLIMEYCSKPNLSQRYKSERIPVADVVATGIQLGGAVETAHRAGILHRDIKPANVLTTDYNWPALTDFGISVATGVATDSDTVGVSIPWSPPEMLSDEPNGDHHADIYSLSATLYTLLAGRSPFERPGGPNRDVDLINRIQRTVLPALGRPDVPPSLERVLARGMAKNPAARFGSVLDLARALQDVQGEQGWSPTRVDVFDEDPVSARAELDPGDDGRTRIRGFTVISAQAPAAATTFRTRGPGAVAPVAGTPLRASRIPADFLDVDRLAAPTPADTMLRAPQIVEAVEAPAAPRPRWPWLVAVTVAVVVMAGVAAILLTKGPAPAVLPQDGSPSTTSGAPVDLGVPAPTELKVARVGGHLVFSWKDPDPQPGDTFQWQRTDTDAAATAHSATGTSVTVTDAHACIEVILVRDNGQFSDPAKICSRDDGTP